MRSTRPKTPQRAVLVAQGAHLGQLRDAPVHREHAVGEYQHRARATGAGFLQAAPQVIHVVVAVAPAARLAQADAVDDGGVVQLVADHRVGFVQQRLEQAAVGVEGGGIEHGVFGAHEGGDARLELLVQVLRAADEAHRGQAQTVAAQRGRRRVE
jgi:hypothetical protein